MLSGVQLFTPPWTAARQASLSLEFSRQEYWSGLPFSTPGDLPDPGIEAMSPAPPAWQTDSLPLAPPGKPIIDNRNWFLTVPASASLRSGCQCGQVLVRTSFSLYPHLVESKERRQELWKRLKAPVPFLRAPPSPAHLVLITSPRLTS